MNVLITGGCGYIGIATAMKLRAYGVNVTLLDNMSKYGQSGAHMAINLNLPVVECDIENLGGLYYTLSAIDGHDCKIDAIVHLAARTSVSESFTMQEKYRRTNQIGTLNIISAANMLGIKKLIFASSAAVYAESTIPVKEDFELNPQSPYAETKFLSECDILNRYDGTPVILRLFNVAGGRYKLYSDNSSAIIPTVVRSASTGKDFQLYGDGSSVRDFVHVEQVAEVILKSLKVSMPKIMNVGNGYESTVKDVLDEAAKFATKTMTFFYNPSRSGEIRYSVANVSLLRENMPEFTTVSLAGIVGSEYGCQNEI